MASRGLRALLSVMLAPAAMAAVGGAGGPPPPVAPTTVPVPIGTSGAAAGAAIAPRTAPAEQVPQLWSPRGMLVVDAPAEEAGRARALFDRDLDTALTTAPGRRRAVFVDLGGTPRVVGLGLAGAGRARVEVFIDGVDGRRALDPSARMVALRPDRWTALSFPAPARATGLVIAWAGTDAREPVAVGEVALFALGPAVDAPADATSAARKAQPAYLAFDVERAGPGKLLVSARSADRKRRAQARIDLERRVSGWQAVPLDLGLPPGGELRVAIGGRGEAPALVGETRFVFYPPLLAGGAPEIVDPAASINPRMARGR